MKFDAIIFDFDGVLIESEYAGNRHLAQYLTDLGHPTTPAEAMARFMGLSGSDFRGAVERHIGRNLPEDFYASRDAEDARVLREGLDQVAGAVAFVRSLPAELPRAIASSSSVDWIAAHLDHLALRDAFGDHLYSGKQHVTRGKPAPDLYLYAAAQLGVPIARCVVLEDSPVGATGAVASGAHVIGLCAGMHCPPDHAATLRALGVQDVAADFDEVARLVGVGADVEAE
ncbi:HAD family hydrolase [Sphingomonas japonica]|uniref:HAD superfamily hydrolase (TIGR01509 family) n=1 Tax=Sphingomonas japonica TaxID=511662 RepID=A0ABX0TYV4_9SPHN|nr:HAD family phosphatase [Sphingomonas japonica]NIJ23495.1 HAD superfamily hydrolase (TIGR01509 family) [Sphingomonas japonica]